MSDCHLTSTSKLTTLFALTAYRMGLLNSGDLRASSNFRPNSLRQFYPIIIMPKSLFLKYLWATTAYWCLPLECGIYITSQPSPRLSWDRLCIHLIMGTALLSTSSTWNHFPWTLTSLPIEGVPQPYEIASTLPYIHLFFSSLSTACSNFQTHHFGSWQKLPNFDWSPRPFSPQWFPADELSVWSRQSCHWSCSVTLHAD